MWRSSSLALSGDSYQWYSPSDVSSGTPNTHVRTGRPYIYLVALLFYNCFWKRGIRGFNKVPSIMHSFASALWRLARSYRLPTFPPVRLRDVYTRTTGRTLLAPGRQRSKLWTCLQDYWPFVDVIGKTANNNVCTRSLWYFGFRLGRRNAETIVKVGGGGLAMYTGYLSRWRSSGILWKASLHI